MALVRQWTNADEDRAVEAGFIWDDATNEVVAVYLNNDTDFTYRLSVENASTRAVQQFITVGPRASREFTLPARLAMTTRNTDRSYPWFPVTLHVHLKRRSS